MKWRRHKHDEVASTAADAAEMDEATKALEDALSRWPAVNDTVSQMRQLRERNHFADSFRHALKGE
jgi:hypothetical protein